MPSPTISIRFSASSRRTTRAAPQGNHPSLRRGHSVGGHQQDARHIATTVRRDFRHKVVNLAKMSVEPDPLLTTAYHVGVVILSNKNSSQDPIPSQTCRMGVILRSSPKRRPDEHTGRGNEGEKT